MTDLRNEENEMRPGLARELIAAGRTERASRTARLLAADALVSAGASAAGAAPAVSWLLPLKWFGVSLLVLGSGDLVWRATRGAVAPATAIAAASPPARPTGAAPILAAHSAAQPRPPRPTEAQPEPAQSSALVSSVPSVSPRRGVDPSTSSASTPARDERLRLELDTLKAARRALDQGAPARALALLHAKTGGFSLLPVEAGIVRIEALQRSGSETNETSARRLAQELLRAHGSGPYGERLRALAGGREVTDADAQAR